MEKAVFIKVLDNGNRALVQKELDQAIAENQPMRVKLLTHNIHVLPTAGTYHFFTIVFERQ